jgi:hypothetical protein
LRIQASQRASTSGFASAWIVQLLELNRPI